MRLTVFYFFIFFNMFWKGDGVSFWTTRGTDFWRRKAGYSGSFTHLIVKMKI